MSRVAAQSRKLPGSFNGPSAESSKFSKRPRSGQSIDKLYYRRRLVIAVGCEASVSALEFCLKAQP